MQNGSSNSVKDKSFFPQISSTSGLLKTAIHGEKEFCINLRADSVDIAITDVSKKMGL